MVIQYWGKVGLPVGVEMQEVQGCRDQNQDHDQDQD